MLVRRLFGPYAGDVIDMDYGDAVAAIKGNSVAPVSPADIERFSVRQVADAAGAMASVEVQKTEEQPKRKGGWPKGKPRKARSDD